MFGPKRGPPKAVPMRRKGQPAPVVRITKEEAERLKQQKYLDELAKEVDRNTDLFERERAALERLERERGARPGSELDPPPPGAFPGASGDDVYDDVDARRREYAHAEIPGLEAHVPTSEERRKFPSWEDDATLGRASVADDARFAEEEITGPPQPNAANAAYHPGAFPGHLDAINAEYGDAISRAAAARASFAGTGRDPMLVDPRAAAEASAKEARNAEFRDALDAQVAAKAEARRRAELANRQLDDVAYDPWGKGGGGAPLRDARGELYADLRGVDIHAGNMPQNVASPTRARAARPSVVVPDGTHRDAMIGVPRRGVNPGHGEYSSPMQRAGGGPSSFRIGGRGGIATPTDYVGFDALRAHPSEDHLTRQERQRQQLIADLDEQVRLKKEAARIQKLKEEIEDAKIDRRIQQVIEEERRILALKAESPVINPQSGNTGVEGGVLAPPLGADDGAPPPPPADAASPAAEKKKKTTPPPDEEDPGKPAPRLRNSPPMRSPVYDPNRGGYVPDSVRRPLHGFAAPSSPPPPSYGGGRELAYADVPGLEHHGGGGELMIPSRSHPSTPGGFDGGVARPLHDPLAVRGRTPSSRGATPNPRELKRIVEELQHSQDRLRLEMEAQARELKDVQLEAQRLARERDLAERERDLQSQLNAIRVDIEGGGNGSVRSSFEFDRRQGAALRASRESGGGGDVREVRRSLVLPIDGDPVDGFVVDSRFVRVDAPMTGDETANLVRRGATVRPGEFGKAVRAGRENRIPKAPRDPRTEQRIRARKKREAMEGRPAWGGGGGGSGGSKAKPTRWH